MLRFVAAASVLCLGGAVIHKDTLGYEHDLHAPEWTGEDRTTWLGNLNINEMQPKTVPAFTALGFAKRKMPPAVYAALSQFLAQNKDSFSRESAVTGYINNRGKSPTSINYIPSSLTRMTNAAMQPILEEWIGGGRPLQHTSTYGIRKYTKGNVLQCHVDVVKTHAVSAILNVGQDNMRGTWPLAIADHQGEVHEVDMEPGEMILYESAKLIHCRPKPLQGDAYYNLFVHFAPKVGYQEHHVDWREDAMYADMKEL
jgi:prolyl 4-hydroxylase